MQIFNNTKLLKYLILLVSITFFSCFEDQDDNGIFASEINDFVWRGMNASYLYKQNINDLSNNRLSSSEEKRERYHVMRKHSQKHTRTHVCAHTHIHSYTLMHTHAHTDIRCSTHAHT